MNTSAFQSAKLAIVASTALSKDALHVYVGLTVMIASILVLRKPLRSIAPWLAVLIVALTGELWDIRDDLASIGHVRWAASIHDIGNTLFWPSLFLILARLNLASIGRRNFR